MGTKFEMEFTVKFLSFCEKFQFPQVCQQSAWRKILKSKMPRKKPEVTATKKRKSPTKKAHPVKQKVELKGENYHMKKWLDGVTKSLTHHDFTFDNELREINSDDESDGTECNLKNLEVTLAAYSWRAELLNSILFPISETIEKVAVSRSKETQSVKDNNHGNFSFSKTFPDNFIRQRYSCDCEWDKCTFETIDLSAHSNHIVDHLIPLGKFLSPSVKRILISFLSHQEQLT